MLTRLRIFALAGLWLAALSSPTPAAEPGRLSRPPVTIDVWETEQGLPDNSILAITQTREGYLWLGTPNGLARFDGIRFAVFDENNTPGLASSRVSSLFSDSRGGLWIGTENAGVLLLKEGRVTAPGRGGREGLLAAACEDASGAVWLHYADGQLWRHDSGTTNALFFAPDRYSLEPFISRRTLIAEKSGPVLAGSDRRLAAFDPAESARAASLAPAKQEFLPARLDYLLAGRDGGHWRLAGRRIQQWRAGAMQRELAANYPWGDARITAACEDREGNLVVGTLGEGVFWFDAQGRAACLSTNEGLSYSYVLSLAVDREGGLWVGTDGGGLNRVKRQVFEVVEPSRGLVVQSVCEDTNGPLWMAFNVVNPEDGGAGRWHDGALRTFGLREGLRFAVRSMFVDRAGQVWAGTFGGLLRLSEGRFLPLIGAELPHQFVQALHEDRQGRLWVGTRGGLAVWDRSRWRTFTTRDGLSASSVRAIADDAEGTIWIGVEDGGLNRWRDDQFTVFRKSPDGLPGDTVTSLWVDESGALWVGTAGGGLARLRQGRWTRLTTDEGLASNSIGYLVEDAEGFLWIGSNAGLMRVAKRALNDFAAGRAARVPCRTYGKQDGLPSGQCSSGSQPGAWRSRDGTVWFPTIKGLASVKPGRLRQNTNPPPVVIESILLEGRPVNPGGQLAAWPASVTVPPGRQRVEIHYTGLNLGAPERTRFRYQLEGHETAWTEAGDARVARYSKLPPGDYRFRVTAGNEDGVWNDAGAVVALIVQPPFWRTWWFLSVSALALLGAVAGAVHYFSTQKLQRQLAVLQQQEALERERARIARDIHDQLGASLTQVALLGEMVEGDKDQPPEVEAHARQICQTARETTRTLDEIVWTVNPSNDTLEGLANYICKYAQDYLAVAGLRYRLEAPPQLPAVAIPPEVRHNVFLAAKEAITNIVRHARATSGWIRLRAEPDRFTVEIADDGRGLAGMDAQRAASRNGLRNMRRRMEDIGGQFNFEAGPEGGALVRLTVPLNHR